MCARQLLLLVHEHCVDLVHALHLPLHRLECSPIARTVAAEAVQPRHERKERIGVAVSPRAI